MARARSSLLGVTTGRRPPCRPRAAAAGEPCHGALFDKIALESRQSAKNMEDQSAAGRRRIDIFP